VNDLNEDGVDGNAWVVILEGVSPGGSWMRRRMWSRCSSHGLTYL